jgi:hypothetical protein
MSMSDGSPQILTNNRRSDRFDTGSAKGQTMDTVLRRTAQAETRPHLMNALGPAKFFSFLLHRSIKLRINHIDAINGWL